LEERGAIMSLVLLTELQGSTTWVSVMKRRREHGASSIWTKKKKKKDKKSIVS
jgi:hypothetical protein